MKRLTESASSTGDPELITVKAVRVLREADVVLVPVLAMHEPGRARRSCTSPRRGPDQAS